MAIKKKLKIILKDTNKILNDLKKAKKSRNLEAINHLLKEIIKLENDELKQLNKILSDISYDDPQLISVLQELSKECSEVILRAKDELNKNKKYNDFNKNLALNDLMNNLENIILKQKELEDRFYKTKKVDFEEQLEKVHAKLPRKESLKQIKVIGNKFKEESKKSDLDKAKEFKKIVEDLGPRKAEKYFKRLFRLINWTDRFVGKLFRNNKNNELFKEAESYSKNINLIDNTSDVDKKIIKKNKVEVPFPEDGFPRGSDFAFILVMGTLKSLLSKPIVSLSKGGIALSLILLFATKITLFFTGMVVIIPLLILVSISFWFLKEHLSKNKELSNKVLNLISYIEQEGSLELIYDEK